MKIKLFLILIMGLLTFSLAVAQEEKKVIRVGISNQSFSNYSHYSAKVMSDSTVSIIDMSESNSDSQVSTVQAGSVIEILFANGLFNIQTDGRLIAEQLQGPILLNSNTDLKIMDLNRKGTPAKYKGMLEFKAATNKLGFNIINVIDMENYLRGVVPNEMPVSFGLEALKAQAVAARNYAVNSAMNKNYDLVDSTASQVYYGSNSYRDISDNAVNSTKGIYALYHGKPITALYFSTSAGITDDWDDVFADANNKGIHPYLKARYDKQGQTALRTEDDVKKFYSSQDGGIDKNSPKYRWTIEFTREELENILHDTLQQQSKAGLVTPKYDGFEKIEGLKEIKPLKRTQSGKITELLIVAKSGEYKISKEIGIRRVLKKNGAMLPSANFYIETSGEDKIKDNKEEINKTDETVENTDKKGNIFVRFFDDIDKYPKNFKLTGGGFGHGVGMSQFGAYNMARMGRKYPEILNHYYTSINLSTYPKTVFYNNYNISYKTEFYFDTSSFKQAYLYVDNSRGVNEFPFKINDFDFSETSDIAKNKVIKTDITQYLKNGNNTIDFAPLSERNKGRYIIYRVEFL